MPGRTTGGSGALVPPDPRPRNSQRSRKHELARLILAAASDRGLSLRGVAKVTGLPVSTIHNLTGGPSSRRLRTTPRPVTLKALADGLDLRLEDVQRAAARAAGVRVQVVTVDVGGHRVELSVELKRGGRELRGDDVAALQRIVADYLADNGPGRGETPRE